MRKQVVDEQEATDLLETLCRSIDRAFRLMRLYRDCQQAASGNKFTLSRLPTTEERFRKRAKEDGYSTEAIDHYLNHVEHR